MEERHNHIGLSHSSFMQCYHGVIPSLFKKAIVHPVYKGHGKNPRDPGSYRPVAILPSLSKVLEVPYDKFCDHKRKDCETHT